jgi:hypothetical protein
MSFMRAPQSTAADAASACFAAAFLSRRLLLLGAAAGVAVVWGPEAVIFNTLGPAADEDDEDDGADAAPWAAGWCWRWSSTGPTATAVTSSYWSS